MRLQIPRPPLVFCLVVMVCTLGNSTYGGERDEENGSSHHQQFKETEFGTGLKTGSTIIEYRETCVWVQIFLISDEFFTHLKKEHTSTGTQFTNGGVSVNSFPERVIMNVEATVYKCTPKPNQIIAPDYAASLMKGASFDVTWGRGPDTRPAALVFTSERHRPGLRWDYFVGITTTDVPLSDDLLVRICLRQGISRTLVRAGLISPPK